MIKLPQQDTWKEIYESLSSRGYARISSLLSADDCRLLRADYDSPDIYRSTIQMQRYRFGRGEYKYFRYPLPSLLQQLRNELYPPLAVVANEWMNRLSIPQKFPTRHEEFLAICKSHQQARSTPLILKYEAGGYNTLHQDLYGEIYFPFQVVVALSQSDVEYSGGQFILVEQVPRAQSRAHAVQFINQGDAAIFATNFRPAQGTRGYYRATLKHGVAEVTTGTRFALGIIFHDAA